MLCDDGSTDKTVRIIHRFMKSDNRVKIVENNGEGLTSALNFGLSHCRGKYVARMDDDDVSLPNRLFEQYYFLEEHSNISLVGSNVSLFDNTGIYGVRHLPKEPSKDEVWRGGMFVHPSVMFRRIDIEKIGRYEDSESTLRIEDYDCWCKFW